MSIEMQRLIFNGKKLNNDKKAEEYGIMAGSVLVLVWAIGYADSPYYEEPGRQTVT